MTSAAETVDDYLPDDDVMLAARARAAELGCPAVAPSTGAALRFLATTVGAKAVVELGTGAGVSGLYLLRGMAGRGDGGVLTSIDIEPEFHRAARTTFREAGFPPGSTRLILGRAVDVLPRLTTGGYDMVFVDAAKVEYAHYFEQGVQLLRPGGVIAFNDVFGQHRPGDRARRDAEATALRDVARAVALDERLMPALLPVGSGLLAAARLEV